MAKRAVPCKRQIPIPFIAAILVALWSCVGSGPSSPPNLLVIMIDTLRPDHLGCYGYDKPTSPVLDALARRGLLFENAFSQASWTKPSVATFFTGKYPIGHRVFVGGTQGQSKNIVADVLRREHVTLAETLRDAGFETAAFVENPQIRSYLGFDQGFDRYEEEIGVATEVAERFLTWYRSLSHEKPYFGYVHMIDPHWPYTPPEPFESLFIDEKPEAFQSREWELLMKRARPGRLQMSEEELETVLALYDGEIRFTDAAIGQVLAALEADGSLDNTLVLVVSDHGEEFYEHGRIGHGRHLYGELLSVVSMIAGPGIGPGRTDAPAELVDWMPTLLEYLGVDSPDGVSGRSLVPVLRGRVLDDKPTFADHRPTGSKGKVTQSVRDRQYKLIRYFEGLEVPDSPEAQAAAGESSSASAAAPPISVGSESTPPDEGSKASLAALLEQRVPSRVELFDVSADPKESADVSKENPSMVENMLNELEAWEDAYATPSDEEARAVLDAETVERLRSLGYIK